MVLFQRGWYVVRVTFIFLISLLARGRHQSDAFRELVECRRLEPRSVLPPAWGSIPQSETELRNIKGIDILVVICQALGSTIEVNRPGTGVEIHNVFVLHRAKPRDAGIGGK